MLKLLLISWIIFIHLLKYDLNVYFLFTKNVEDTKTMHNSKTKKKKKIILKKIKTKKKN